MKSQFLAHMSHELRTPLSAIVGYTHLLLAGVSGPLGDPQREKLSRIASNAGHLTSLINDLLDVERIESGRMPLHVAPFRLEELVTEVMTEMEALVARSALAVTTR